MNLRSNLLGQVIKVEYLVYLTFGILFYILNSYSQISLDDWYYKFICEDENFFDPAVSRIEITTIRDVLRSQVNHWQYVNGRFVVHVLVQLFVGILGIKVFQVVNTIFFVFFIKNFCQICIPNESNRSNINEILLPIICLLIFIGFIGVGKAYITSVAFSINYLWSATLYVWLIRQYYNVKNIQTLPKCKLLIMCALSLLCGAMNESFSVGLSMSLFFYYIVFYRGQFKGNIKYIVLSLWIGTFMCCASPSNFSRLMLSWSAESDISVVSRLMDKILYFGLNYKLVIPIIIFLIIFLLYWLFRRKNVICFIKENMELLMTFFFSFLFIVATGLSGNHQMFMGTTIICSILTSKIIINFVNGKSRMLKISSICILPLCLLHYSAVLSYTKQSTNEYIDNIEEYESACGVIEYNPVRSLSIIETYGFTIPRYRMGFAYSGLELVYGYKPQFIPDRNLFIHLNIGEIYDADWCYVISTPEDIEYEVKVADFTHKNWMLKLWSKFSDSATSQFYLDSYEVMLNDQKYTIALKKNDDFIINKIELIHKDIN